MEMNIDAQRIRLERERRAWTQEQLAGATGLGLRTVQRIEREGRASFESVQAIAAALELTIAELRLDTASLNPRELHIPFMLQLVFAALSGVAVNMWVEWSDGLMANRAPVWDALSYLVPGGLFAAGVLIPQLGVGRTFVRRALALVVASAASFYVAVRIAADGWLGLGQSGPSLPSLLVASLVGVAIVLPAAHWLIGMGRPVRLWVFGFIAAVLGAVVLHFGANTSMFDLPHESFAAWHVLLCVAIRVGRGKDLTVPSMRPLIRSVREVLPGGKLWRLSPQAPAVRIGD